MKKLIKKMTEKHVQLCESLGRKKVPSTLEEFLKTDNIIITFTTGRHDPVDFYAETDILGIVGEVKNYIHERSLYKYKDYLIDWGKVICLKAEALAKGKLPLVICYFTDYTAIWDLTNIDLDERRDWEWVNKDGENYGQEKEYSIVTYLLPTDAVWIKKVS